MPPTTIGSAPSSTSVVDLGVRELGVLAGAELRIDGQEGDQPVLELRALRRPGRSGQDLEAGIHLQRVGRDRNRPFAALAETLRQRDRHRGLSDSGRTEQSDHLGAPHAAQYREAIEVEVLQ